MANADEDMRDAIFQSTLAYIQHEDHATAMITNDFDEVMGIWRLMCLVQKVIKSKGVLFSLKKEYGRKRLHYAKLGWNILSALRGLGEFQRQFPMHKPHPYAELFYRLSQERNLYHQLYWAPPFSDAELQNICDVLNGFVESIRSEARTAKCRASVNHFIRAAKENYASLIAYLNAWFQDRSRLLVLRVDWGYRKERGWPDNKQSATAYEEVKKHREDFFSKMRSCPELFEHLLGYAIKLEYGLEKGFHYHGLFLFDGAKVREDVTLARLIGERWVAITEDKGLYFNCNAQKSVYPQCGIGMVHADDTVAREGLKKIAQYMTKCDSVIKLVPPGNGRSFFKGEMPKPKEKKRGRPRQEKGRGLEQTGGCDGPSVMNIRGNAGFNGRL